MKEYKFQYRERTTETTEGGGKRHRYHDPEPIKNAVFPNWLANWFDAAERGYTKEANRILDEKKPKLKD